MTLRAYLILLRPVRTLLLGLINSGCCGVFFLRYCGKCSLAEASSFTSVIVAPLIFGDLLAGPAHEFMNRSVFPLIPGARHQLRRWHMLGTSVLGFLLLAATDSFASAFPFAARLGLIAAGLTLPLLNTRRVGWSYLALLLLISPLLAAGPRETFAAACQAAPWAIFSLGLLCAGLCIRRIFSTSFAGNYWKTPYVVSVQTLAPFYDTAMIQRRREDAERRAFANGNRRAREWLADSVGPSLRDWARVIRHARFGGASWVWSGTGAVVFGAFPALTYLALPIVFGILGDKAVHSPLELCSQVLAGARGNGDSGTLGHLAFQSLPLSSIMIALYAASVSAVPTTGFPLSRRRLADCLFAELLRLGALCCLGFALASFGPIVGAALLSQTPIEFAFFGRALRHVLFLPTVALLGIAVIYTAVRTRWLASFGGYLLCAAVCGALGGFAMAVAESRLWVFIWFPGFVLSGWAARATLRRYYATNDLNRLMPWAARFAGRVA
jgi:hypothetical protein